MNNLVWGLDNTSTARAAATADRFVPAPTDCEASDDRNDFRFDP
jgi:hypothetical protein